MLPRLAPRPLVLVVALAALAVPARAQFGTEQLIGSGGWSAQDAQAADLDGDGDADVLAAHSSPPPLNWYENLGGGAFGPAQPFGWIPLDQPLYSVESVRALDYDDDGDLDVFAAADHYTPEFGTYERVDLWRNLGGGSFEPVGTLAAVGGTSAQSLRLVDLENDGDLDVTWAEWGNDAVKVIKSLPGGTLSAPIKLTDSANGPTEAQPGDQDADGDADLAVASYPLDHVVRLENRDGNTSFGPPLTVDPDAPGAFAVNLADLDDDGYAELFSCRSFGFDKAVTLYRNTGGDFAAPQVISTIGSPSSGIRGSDVDGDGDPDLLVNEFYGASWYPNDGAGNFGARQVVTKATVNVGAAEPADLNGDGVLDVLMASNPASTARFAWYENLADPPSAWTDLGSGLAGVAGVPQLVGDGTLLAGSPGSLVLTSAAPSAMAMLFVSLSSAPQPFKGGTLVPVPALASIPLVTGPSGALMIPWAAWPAGLSGQDLYFQYAVQDAAAVKGVALSHAVKADVP